jgi:alanine-glyoxylate transaminase/serine-glyoxylate transaminase/serine-pyruvate transaminase
MIDETLTMIPGPTPVHPRILAALAKPTVSHLAPDFVAAYRRALDDFRTLGQSSSAQPFIVAGGGTLAMEMALVNVVRPGGRVLVISQGYFGDRYEELAKALGLGCEVARCEWGRAVPAEEVSRRLARGAFDAVTITHVDTSTGSCAPVADYCELLRGREEALILDGVCATGGIDEPFDTWGVDVLLTAPQKAIGAPPGLAMCLFSESALARRRRLTTIPAYYADVLRWLPIMEDPGRYYSTPCVNQIFAVAEALRMVFEEGLAARFARHRRVAAAFRAGLEALGLRTFTAKECRANTLSVVLYPEGVDDAAFRGGLAKRGVVVAGGLGSTKGRAFRLGHMGNIDAGDVAATLHAIEATLAAAKVPVKPGSAVMAAAPLLAHTA